VPLAGI